MHFYTHFPKAQRYAAQKQNTGPPCDPALQSLGRNLQRPQQEPHIKAIASILETGAYTMGGAPGGDMVAEAMFNRLDEINAQAYQEAPDIE